jgi:peptide-methionine (S)-S-oxide reductase
VDEELIGLGGGCHWCTEAVFQGLRGAASVEQGFAAASEPDDAFAEAVRVRFDPAALPLDVLLEVHLRTHSSTSAHKLRGKYRSAVYVHDEDQAERARAALTRLAAGFDQPLVTRVLPFAAFRPSDARYRDYYATDPARPFCRTYIEPKLALLRRRFAAHAT